MPVMDEVMPFPVVCGKYLFWFTPAEEGGFTVSCQNVYGVNAEGDTFEEALEHAKSMAAFVEKQSEELKKRAKHLRSNPVFGIWKDRDDLADPAEVVRKLREGRGHALCQRQTFSRPYGTDCHPV